MNEIVVFVVLACSQQLGCQEMTQAYYIQNQDLQYSVKAIEEKVKNNLNPYIINYAAPIAGLLYGNTANIKLNGRQTLNISKTNMGWQYVF